MRATCLWLSRFFGRLADWFGQPNIDTAALQQRMRTLLSKDDLTEDEEAELANIITQFNGRVIVLPSKGSL